MGSAQATFFYLVEFLTASLQSDLVSDKILLLLLVVESKTKHQTLSLSQKSFTLDWNRLKLTVIN